MINESSSSIEMSRFQIRYLLPLPLVRPSFLIFRVPFLVPRGSIFPVSYFEERRKFLALKTVQRVSIKLSSPRTVALESVRSETIVGNEWEFYFEFFRAIRVRQGSGKPCCRSSKPRSGQTEKFPGDFGGKKAVEPQRCAVVSLRDSLRWGLR